MTYQDISDMIDPLGYSHAAIKWNSSSSVPDIFIRYYLVSETPVTTFNNNQIEIEQFRYTFEVNARDGEAFEGIFDEVKEAIEKKDGFNIFFNIGDGIHDDTGHYYKSGDIYYQEVKQGG